MHIRLVHEDDRGKTFAIIHGERERAALCETKKGAIRGGHFHPEESSVYVIYGSFTLTITSPNSDTKQELVLREGQSFNIPPNAPHMLMALEDSAFVEIWVDFTKTIDYEPMRKIIRERLRKTSEELVP